MKERITGYPPYEIEATRLSVHYSIPREILYRLALDVTKRFSFYSVFPRFPIEEKHKDNGQLWIVGNIPYNETNEVPLEINEEDILRISDYIRGWIQCYESMKARKIWT